MICSSLNLDRFIVRLPYHDGLYTNLEEFQGLRSQVIAVSLGKLCPDFDPLRIPHGRGGRTLANGPPPIRHSLTSSPDVARGRSRKGDSADCQFFSHVVSGPCPPRHKSLDCNS
jgi:hypothetical protein